MTTGDPPPGEVAKVRQRFLGVPWNEFAGADLPSEVATFMNRIRTTGRVPVIALTIVNDELPVDDPETICAVRDPKTNETHGLVLSVVTGLTDGASLDSVVSQVIGQGTMPRINGDIMTFEPDVWMPSNHHLRGIALTDVVKALSTRKLGLGDHIETGGFVFTTGPFSITITEVSHPVANGVIVDPADDELPDSYLREEIAMLQVRVGVVKGFDKIPDDTIHHEKIVRTPRSRFLAMIEKKNAAIVLPRADGAYLCVRGACTRTAAALASAVRPERRPVLVVNSFKHEPEAIHREWCIETAQGLRGLTDPAAAAAHTPIARIDSYGTVRFALRDQSGEPMTLAVRTINGVEPPAQTFEQPHQVRMLAGRMVARLWRPAPAGVSITQLLTQTAGNHVWPCFRFDQSNQIVETGSTVLVTNQHDPQRSPAIAPGEKLVIEPQSTVQLLTRCGISPFAAYLEDVGLPSSFTGDLERQWQNGDHPHGPDYGHEESLGLAGKLLGLLKAQYPEIQSGIVRPIETATLR